MRYLETKPRKHCEFLFMAFLSLAAGCSSPPKQIAEPDDTIERHSRNGMEAFQEGLLKNALKEYKSAVVRSWIIDDPYESGTAAYNLAGCYFGERDFEQAKLWLIDSRVDLTRANVSTGNAWLMTANIAAAENQIELANDAIHQAKCAGASCLTYEQYRLRGPAAKFVDENCKPPLSAKLPWIGKKVLEKKRLESCKLEHSANIHLSLARVALLENDLCKAREQLKQSGGCEDGLCSLTLQASRHDIAAEICDLEFNYMQAGAHRDREVELLRSAGEYRELPEILRDAADSYAVANRLDLAIDRLIRCSRIYLARQEFEKAWNSLKLAGELIDVDDCDANRVRFQLTGQVLQEAIQKNVNTLESVTANDSVEGPIKNEFENSAVSESQELIEGENSNP